MDAPDITEAKIIMDEEIDGNENLLLMVRLDRGRR